VAIDDMQWLDRASERALEFAARRLPAQVGLLLRADPLATATRRSASTAPYRNGQLESIVPGPFSLAALHHLIRNRLGTAPAAPR